MPYDVPTRRVTQSRWILAPRFVRDHRAQSFQVRNVLLQILFLGCFQHLGNFRESSIAHDKAKCFETDAAFPDVFVPVHARTAGRFGIVKMNRGQSIAADDAVELGEMFF